MAEPEQNPLFFQDSFHHQRYTYEVKERVGGTEYIPVHIANRSTKAEGETESEAELRIKSDPWSCKDLKVVFIKYAFLNESIEELRNGYNTSLAIYHDDLLGVEESFVSRGRFCVVLDYMANSTLKSVLYVTHPNGLSENLIVMALRSVVLAVKFLHDSYILHKKITADNVLVNTTYPIGPLELDAEFDIKLAYSASLFNYENEPFAEMCNSGFTYKSDILSIGIMTLQLCYGTEVWQKNEEGLRKMVTYIRKMKRLPPKKHDHKVPSKMNRLITTTFKIRGSDKRVFSKKLEQFVVRCLAEEPRKRPTAQELLAHDIFHT